MFNDFVNGVAASLVAALIFSLGAFAIGLVTSHRFRWLLIGLFSRLLRTDIDDVFPSRHSAEEDFLEELRNTSTLRLFTSRGTDLHSSSVFAKILDRARGKALTQVRILLPDPLSRPGQFDWTERRDRECKDFDDCMGNGALATQIRSSLDVLAGPAEKKLIELATLNTHHLARIIITDTFAYFGPYSEGGHGSDTRVFKYRSGGVMYNFLRRFFDQHWEAALFERARKPFAGSGVIEGALPIKALVFDCDGTIADSMPLHYECLRDELAAEGIEITYHDFLSRAGLPTTAIVQELATAKQVVLSRPVAQLAAAKEERFLARLEELRPIGWVLDVIHANRGRRPLAVASGATRQVLKRQLQHLGIADVFDVVIAAEDVNRPKPAPDAFLQAATRLNVPPEHCLVYEDGDFGIEAARAAGTQWIDIRGIKSHL